MIRLFTRLLVITILLLTPLTCRQLQVPVIKNPTQRDLKLSRLQQIQQPEYNFNYVQSRQVFKADAQMTPFSPCHQNKPEVTFTITDRINFDAHPAKPLVLYKFQDVQFSQYLLDAFVDGAGRVYMIFQDGKAATVSIDDKKNMRDLKIFQIDKLQDSTKLQPGYFVQLSSQILFINNKHAILVSKDHAQKLQGYKGGLNFMTAISINNTYIAVAFEEAGVVFYWYSDMESKLEEFAYLPPSRISSKNSVQVVDLAYFGEERALVVLEEGLGVLAFGVDLVGVKDVKIGDASIVLKRQACNMMSLHEKSLYVVCGDVYQVSLHSWPKIQQKILPHPNLKIRQIYVEGPLVAFVGRNIFKLMYLGRLVNYFEDQKMDKLIFQKDLFISANEGGLLIGKYQIIQPYITCQTVYEQMIGSHPLIFKTIAECNQQFLDQNNIKLNSLNSFTEDDTCIYTVERTLYFWKTGEIMILPIVIVLLVLVVISFGVALVWLLKRVSIGRFQRELEEYTSLTTVENQKHQELVEEQPESSGNNKSGASNNLEEEDVQSGKENPNNEHKDLQVQMQNHDIQ